VSNEETRNSQPATRNTDMNPNHYKKAKKKVKEKKEFQKHLQSYLTTLAILFAMSFLIPPLRRVWAMIAFFWGIGLFSHYVKAYGFPGMEDEDEWEQKEIEKEMRRMEAKDRWQNRPPNRRHPTEDDDIDMDDYLDLEKPRPVPKKKYRDEDLV